MTTFWEWTRFPTPGQARDLDKVQRRLAEVEGRINNKVDPMFKTKKVPSLATVPENSALRRRFSPRPCLKAFFPAPQVLHNG